MSDLNQVYLQGRLVKSAELTILSTGTPLVRLSVAVNKSIKDKAGNWSQRTSFFDCDYFGEWASKSIPELTKGREVLIEGELRQDRWEKDGKTFSAVKINASKVRPLRRPGEGKNASNADSSNNQYNAQTNAEYSNAPEPDYPPDWDNLEN